MSSNGICSFIEVLNFCAMKHKNQRRKDPDKSPYINHPIGVAYILSSEGEICDEDVLKAAILHDTIEDTDTTYEEVLSNFGARIADLVKEVSDDKSLPKLERKRLQILYAPDSSHEAKLLKLADKLHNLRDLEMNIPEGWDEERVMEYFKWASEVIDGCRGTNEKIEEELDKILEKKLGSSSQTS